MRSLLAAIGIVCAAGMALAQDKPVELRFSHWVPPTHAMHATALEWAKSIDKESGGTIKISVFPAQQLGKAPDHYDMAAKGIADIVYVSTGYQAGRMILTGATLLPFRVSDPAGGSRAFDEWYRPHATKDMPNVRMCLMFVHDPGSLHSKAKITHPDQIKGMKIRPAHTMVADWVKLLGGTNVALSAPESREALERGLADAITFPWASLYLFGIDKITKFHIDAPMYVSSFAWLINPAKYVSLSAGQKKAMDAHCNADWAYRVGKEWGDQEIAGRAKMKADPTHTVTALSPAELAAWRKSAEPLTAAWSDEVRKQGYDPDKLLADLDRALIKHKAKM